MRVRLLSLTALLLLFACGQNNTITIPCQESTVRLQVVAPEIVRVSVSPDGKFNDRQSLAVVPQKGSCAFTKTVEEGIVRVKTDSLTVEVDKATGAVFFFRADGTLLTGNARSTFQPIEVEGKQAYSVRTQLSSTPDESFYGLGQHQAGEFDHKNRSEELFQYNTKVSVPMVVSTKGYGLMFDAYSLSRWGNPYPYRQLGETFKLYDKDGVEGALTGTYRPFRGEPLVQREDSLYYETEFHVKNLPAVRLAGSTVTYEGYLEAPETADYHFIQYYAGFQQTEVGGQEVMSRRWRAAWNPNSYKFTVHLEKGVKTPLKIEWEPDGDVSYIGLRVAELLTPEEEAGISFWSEFEPYADYYFIAGNNYDQVISGYRTLTGKAPVMPKWVMGFWQSRERYSTQDELVETLAEMRRRHIPVDNIVQDWYYWK